jgi:hypothetical protein
MRPKLNVEKIIDGEIQSIGRSYPHCDMRVLHAPDSCTYCADATDLQEERERLDVSNTGLANRAWPCPADRARGSASLNTWPGNRPRSPDDKH